MHFFIGSTNPVKINSVKLAIVEQWPEAVVTGFDVPSGVSHQPMTDEETREGSANRARAALAAGLESLHLTSAQAAQSVAAGSDEFIGIGLEGGVFTNSNDELWSTVWCSLIDAQGTTSAANGGRIKVPEVIATVIKAGGEMSPVVQQLTGLTDVKKTQGMFGVITKGMVDRTQEYAAIAKICIGLWYGRDWDHHLS